MGWYSDNADNDSFDAKDRVKRKFLNYFVNDGVKLVWIILWVLGSLACFFERFFYYYTEKDLEKADSTGISAFSRFGYGVTIARGAAAAIKLNSALLLVTVLRNTFSLIRKTPLHHIIPIDKMIVFHRHIAWSVAFWTGLHNGAHFFNIYVLWVAEQDKSVFNAVLSLPGWTGVAVTLCMGLMYSSALKWIRHQMFNVFWYIHHLFIIYFAFIMFHGASGLLEAPTFWIWTGPFVLLYIIERVLRVVRGTSSPILEQAIAHPANVIELKMKKSGFNYKSGQYLFLNCPTIARHEWHPFTITSSPDDDFVSVHVAKVGDWTGELFQLLNPNNQLGIVAENVVTSEDGKPILKIDGGYGAASEDLFDFDVAICVAGGIGVTPFASILRTIRHRKDRIKLKKLYFIWTARDRNAFEWFSALIADLETDPMISHLFQFDNYLTGAMKPESIKDIMYADDVEGDAITGLQTPTHFGRPDWDKIFSSTAEIHPGEKVGVFLCGPKILSKTLAGKCREYVKKTSTKFVFHKENF